MRKSNLARSVELAFGEDLERLLERLVTEEGYSVPEVARMIRQRGVLVAEGTVYRWLRLLGYRLEWNKQESPNLLRDRGSRPPRGSSRELDEKGAIQ